jgi:Flp pilus assembly protein TadB
VSGEAALVLSALGAVLLLWPPRGTPVRRRLQALRPAAGLRSDPVADDRPAAARRRRWVLAGSAGGAATLLVGGALGVAVGALVAVAADRVLGRAGDSSVEGRGGSVRDLPIACDLLVVCLAAGLPVAGALAAVATAVPGAVGDQIGQVSGLYRLGADPRRAWADVQPHLTGLGRIVVRAGESGSAITAGLRSLATEARAAERAAAEAAVRRAGVWVLAPLGLCFLPAFVCLGVAPLVLGIARDVFGG